MNTIQSTSTWRRRIVTIAALGVMVIAMLTAVGQGSASAASCHPYPDVTSSNPHCDNIAWLKKQAITKPADGNYHPLNSVNRGSMAAFLFRIVNPGESQPRCTAKPFPDVATDSTFCGYIQWAKNSHIAYGYPDGTYGPENAVTRGAMAAYLQRISSPGQPAAQCTRKPFDDVAITDTFCGVITWMVKNKITYGVGDGTDYGTTQHVTRQSMASFLHRISDGPLALAGTYFVGSDIFNTYDSTDNYYGVWFLDNEWAYWGMPKKGEPACTTVTGKPRANQLPSTGWGCVKYHYNAVSGKLTVGGLHGSYHAEKARPLTINKSNRYWTVHLPKAGKRYAVQLVNYGWFGSCPAIGPFSNCVTHHTNLTLQKNGTFARTHGSIVISPVGDVGTVAPDERGTYRVLGGARIVLSFADGHIETHTIAEQYGDNGKPDPADKHDSGGLVLGTDWYWADVE